MALAAVWPRPQIDASCITLARSSSRARSSTTSPSTGLTTGRRLARAPRDGAGPPPGGRCRRGTGRTDRRTRRGRTRRCATGTATRSTVSSSTITTPEPRVGPAARVPSNVSGTSRSAGPTNPPAAPPSSTAWSGRPPATPPASASSSRQRRPERDLVDAGHGDLARQAEQLRAGGAVGAGGGVRGPAVQQDRQHVHQGLDVVDQRRAAEQADVDGERRLVAGLAPLALDGVEDRGLLAADVGAGASEDLDVEAHAAAHHVVAEVAERPGTRRWRAAGAAGPAGTRPAGRSTRARPRRCTPATMMASSTPKGSPSISTRSLNVPGSLSSALQTSSWGWLGWRATASHLRPAGKAAPPRPSSFDSCSSREHAGRAQVERRAQRLEAAVGAVGGEAGRVDAADPAQEHERRDRRPGAPAPPRAP